MIIYKTILKCMKEIVKQESHNMGPDNFPLNDKEIENYAKEWTRELFRQFHKRNICIRIDR